MLSEAFNIDVVDELPDTDDPRSFKDAMNRPEKDLWEDACKEEFESLKEMRVFTLIPPTDVPPDRKVLRGKWVLSVKRDKEGRPVRYKARYVFWGCGQVPGRDYNRTTSPTARLESFRMLLHIAASLDWDMRQFDVKTAFLHGLLDEEEFQYMEQPEGFKEPGKEDWVWRVEKGLYGMHQAGRVWNRTLNDAMVSEWGFTRLPSEYCVYYRQDSHGTVITAVHVDDFISIASSAAANQRFRDQMLQKWKISESAADFHLGIAIQHDRPSRSVFISQIAMIDAVVQDFCPLNTHPVSTPMSEDANETLRRPLPDESISQDEVARLSKLPYRNLVARLMYIGLGTRFDIVWSIRKLAEFLDCYRQSHWDAAIRVVRYLKSTRDLRLRLGGEKISLVGFTDSSWADDRDNRRSSMGYCFTLGSGVISWSARKQKTVTCSSTEAEYIAASESCREAVWLRMMLSQLNQPCPSAIPLFTSGFTSSQLLTTTPLYCDNNGAICLAHDPQFHSRAKHIDYRHHQIRDRIESKDISLLRVDTYNNLADIFTKPLGRLAFTRFRGLLGLG